MKLSESSNTYLKIYSILSNRYEIMPAVSRIGKRYTVVIPKEIRSKVSLKEGDLVIMRVIGDEIIIQPLPEDPFKVLGEVIGESYNERRHERKALEELIKHAGR